MWRRIKQFWDNYRHKKQQTKTIEKYTRLLEAPKLNQHLLNNFLETQPITFMELLEDLSMILKDEYPQQLFDKQMRYNYQVETHCDCVESILSRLNEVEHELKTKNAPTLQEVRAINRLLDDWWLTQIDSRVNTKRLIVELARLCESVKQLFLKLDVSNQRYYLTFYGQIRRDLMVILVLLLKAKQ